MAGMRFELVTRATPDQVRRALTDTEPGGQPRTQLLARSTVPTAIEYSS